MKKYLLLFPELIILFLSVLWLLDNYFISSIINYYAIGVIGIILIQLFFKIKFLGIAIGSIIALFSLYMILAVLSEFHDFKRVNFEALQLLFVGCFLCFLGLITSCIMIYKNVVKLEKESYLSF